MAASFMAIIYCKQQERFGRIRPPFALASARLRLMSVAAQSAAPRIRLESVDVLRGVVMILMALDHSRDFFGDRAANPVDIATTTVPLFFTRWVTHICAPTFFLLTGTGAWLSRRRKSTSELSQFLFTRGLWLIFLEFTIGRFGLQFNFDYHVTFLIVLWALGWAMIVLAALVYFPAWVSAAFGAVMIASHNLLDAVTWNNPVWSILYSRRFVFNLPGFVVRVAYPLIPWVGVTAVGYALAQIYSWPSDRRRKFLLRLGFVLIAAFLVLRAINRYGDPNPWSAQSSVAMTIVSFLDTTKYPPSLMFLLMTLGPAMLILWAIDASTPRLLRPALIFGRVPMFYYLLHFPLIHLLATIVCGLRYGHIYWMHESPTLDKYPFALPPGWGYSLPVVYLVWISVVVALYPVCRWFAGVRQRRSDTWLSYF
jgi:uncharacterized membrane protein